jgi:hypothetical protein
MADGIDKAAAAFEAVINGDPNTVAKKAGGKGVDNSGPPEVLFGNVGELDPDTDARGGGDDEDETDGSETEKDKADPRNPRKRDKEAEDGGDESDDDGDGDESDGDAGDDGDPESDDELPDDGEETSKEDAELLKREVELTVDGEPVTVSLKEALEGYVRTETFHRRMNQLDEAKKIVRRAAADAVQNYEHSMDLAKEMQAHMDKMIPKEPDWDEEFKKNPEQARSLQKYYEQTKAFRDELRGKMTEAQKKVAESNSVQLAAFAEEESSKFDAMNRKTWSDPKKKAKDLQSMRRTGLTLGFSEDELSQVYDSRMLQVLLKASKYDRMMASKPKPVVKNVNKPITPGAGNAKQRTAQRDVSSAMKRLNRTGRIDDAAVVFDQLIARG